MQSFNILTRRGFLDRSFKIGLGVALSTLTDVPLVVKRALAEGNIGLNGKKLLFIFLRGANDGLNSLIPIMDSAYTDPTVRPTGGANIGIPPGAVDYTATNINCDFVPSGGAGGLTPPPTFPATDTAIRLGNGFAALHPALRFLAPVYNAGDLALIHRVGYPRQSRSHFDSQNYWETGTPNNNLTKDGIFYRTMVQSGLANVSALTGVSIQSALPLSLQGSAAAMTNLVDPTRYNLLGVPNNTAGNLKADRAIFTSDQYPFTAKQNRELLDLQYKNLTDTLAIFAQIYFDDAHNTFVDAQVTGDDLSITATDGDVPYYLFPNTNAKNGGANLSGRSNVTSKYVVDPGSYSLFTNLKAASLILNNTDAIVAGTEYGSFDLHQTQGGVTGSHAKLLRSIGWAMYALRKYFKIYGKGGTNPTPGAKVGWNDLVVVTLSEFGRTTVQNSSVGTDHAEGGVMFVAGGGVQGRGKNGVASGVFACGPADVIPWNIGLAGTMFGAGGRYLKRAVDYRSVLGKLIRDHLGATQNQLNQIIPGYANSSENLLAGGPASDGVPIYGELPIV